MKFLIKNFVYVLIIFLIISGVFALLFNPFEQKTEISLSKLVEEINQEKIENITVAGSEISILFRDGTEAESRKESESSLTESLITLGVDSEKLRAIEIKQNQKEEFGFGLRLF